MKKVFHELLFWGHFVFIIAAMLMGLVLPLWLVVLLIIAHRIHVLYCGECLFSRLQIHMGGLEKEQNFLQDVTRRLFHKKITKKQATRLDYGIVSTSLFIAALHALL